MPLGEDGVLVPLGEPMLIPPLGEAALSLLPLNQRRENQLPRFPRAELMVAPPPLLDSEDVYRRREPPEPWLATGRGVGEALGDKSCVGGLRILDRVPERALLSPRVFLRRMEPELLALRLTPPGEDLARPTESTETLDPAVFADAAEAADGL